MSWRRGKTTSGWAAFDLKQQGKQSLESVADAEPYPSLSSSIAPPEHSKNLTGKKQNGLDGPVLLEKPFGSVIVRTVDFPAMTVNERDKTADTRLRLGGDSRSAQGSDAVKENGEELSILQASKKLEERFAWAGRSLIEDILVGVNNNIDEASSMLKAMESSKNNEAETEELKSCSEEVGSKVNTSLGNKDVTSLKTAYFADLKNVIEYDKQKETGEEALDDHAFLGNMLLSDVAATNKALSKMRFYPVEPEPELEEEDDVYLAHRKDAIRMMRSASHHSKAATDAYVRGDHLSAQHYSREAQEKWIAAQRLNAEAAKEILSIRNRANDLWTLDLHGLHAAEAIQALQEHLQKIESLVSFNHIASVNRSSTMPINPLSVSVDSSGCYGRMKDNELPSSFRKSANLQVITGKGNHSRGQAALPAAVRSFLSENGYHYDESRAGVITVRPKFRRG